MELIDGNEIASAIVEELTALVSSFGKKKPCVAFVRVGEDPASVSYVRKKEKTAGQIGIEPFRFPETISQEGLLQEIGVLNRNPGIHGILVQAPPDHMDDRTVFNHVSPKKRRWLNATTCKPVRRMGMLCFLYACQSSS